MRSKRHREVASDTRARPGWALIIWCDPLSCTGGVCQVVLNLANELNLHGLYRPIVIVNEWTAARPRMEMHGGVHYVFVRMREPPDFARMPPSPDDRVPLYKRI